MKNTFYIVLNVANTEDRVDIYLLLDSEAFHTSTSLTQTDSQQVMQILTEHMNAQELSFSGCRGIGLIQGASRFTVARLAGVIANGIGWSLQVPVIEYTTQPSFSQIEQDCEERTYESITIAYTADPTITL